MSHLVIIQDTREQKPFNFACVEPMPTIIVKTLAVGDYSLEGFEDRIVVERKSLPDLFSSLGNGRERFERQIKRMKNYDYAAVVVEGDWVQVFRNPPAMSKMNPRSVLATIIAWGQRYDISFWMCPNRFFAERITYKILERFYMDNGRNSNGKS